MKILATAAAVALISAGVLSAPATALTPLESCLAQPGRVAANAVTDGNDMVCLGPSDERVASLGDDTYFWVEGDDVVAPAGEQYDDPGYDRLSLADWSTPYVDTYDANGYGGMFGVKVLFNVEAVTYTAFNDVVGDRNACSGLTQSSETVIDTGLGNDVVQCVTGNIYTRGGDDQIIGVTLDSTAYAGPGADKVWGDAQADLVKLGDGDDWSKVEGDGASDIVYGEAGYDIVRADPNDVTYGVQEIR